MHTYYTILVEFCSEAAWGPVKENLFHFPGASERPADIVIPNYSGSKNHFLDVAVTCPVQLKYVVDAAQTHRLNIYPGCCPTHPPKLT